MKMLVEEIVIPLIFKRQLEMGIDPTSVIIEPRPKINGSGSNILNATYLTSNKINHVFRAGDDSVIYDIFR